jgi:taurine dioxygenase
MGTTRQLRTRPLHGDFGVEIHDVDVTRADADTLAAVVSEFNHHGAVLVRGQSLDRPAQIAFTELFGEPGDNVRKDFVDPEYPKIYIISNKVVDGRVVGEHDAGFGWHTDLATSQRPALCTILYALEVPDEGSDTLIADMCAAWNAVPAERQQQIDGFRVHHSFIEMMRQRGLKPTQEHQETMPDVFHPIVRRHVFDGRKALCLGGKVKGIVGLPNPEGLDLIDELMEYATQERFIYRHKWKVGDLLVWDDRVTLHTGTPFDLTKYVRYMNRTWVRGEIPQ